MPRSPTRALPLRIVGFLLVLVVVALTMRSVAAQSPGEKPESEKPSAAAPGDPPKSFGMSLREMLAAGGTIGWVIIGLSVAMVALMFQQMLTLRYVSLIPPGLPEQTHALIQQGLLRQAEQTCQESQSFLGNMLANALAEAPLGYAAMNKAMEDSAAEQSARLLRRVDYFSVIGTLAPMLGLLGTVWGMILAFMEFEQKANPQVSELAPGIYKALVTTLQGLTVAIPALALFAFFRNRVDELVAQASLMAEHIFADFRRARAARRREQRNKRRRRPGPNSGPSASPPAAPRPPERPR